MHDAVAVAHVIRDDLVQTADRGVVVDTGGELSRGRTYVDLWGRAGWEPNATWAWTSTGRASSTSSSSGSRGSDEIRVLTLQLTPWTKLVESWCHLEELGIETIWVGTLGKG